jgi:hypothetical protein
MRSAGQRLDKVWTLFASFVMCGLWGVVARAVVTAEWV